MMIPFFSRVNISEIIASNRAHTSELDITKLAMLVKLYQQLMQIWCVYLTVEVLLRKILKISPAVVLVTFFHMFVTSVKMFKWIFY